MPAFSLAKSAFLFSSAAHASVAELSATDILHPGPIVDGTPWPELVSAVASPLHLDQGIVEVLNPGPIIDGLPPPDLVSAFADARHLDLAIVDILHGGPIIDGVPPPDLVLDFSVFG